MGFRRARHQGQATQVQAKSSELNKGLHSEGGWPRLLTSRERLKSWVPHPRVLCEGGYGAARSSVSPPCEKSRRVGHR